MLRLVFYAPGEMVICEGELAREMYFIKQGRVEIFVKATGANLCIIESGYHFGEVACMFAKRRGARSATSNSSPHPPRPHSPSRAPVAFLPASRPFALPFSPSPCPHTHSHTTITTTAVAAATATTATATATTATTATAATKQAPRHALWTSR